MRDRAKRYLTIHNEMFLLGFLFLIAVSLLFAGIFLRLLYANNMESAKNSLRECNSQIVTYTEGMFHENATVVDILSRDTAVIQAGSGETEAVIDIFDAIQKRNANITYIYSGYENGSLLINNYPTPMNFDSTTRPWYRAAMATNGVARLVYKDAATGVWLFSQSMKMTDENGRILGAVCIDCSNESISRQLSTKYQYDSQRSFIVDPKGTVLIHPNENEINTYISEKLSPAMWSFIVSGTNNYAEYLKDNIMAMAYFERIPETQFIVVTAIDRAEVNGPILRSTLYLLLLILGISLVLGMILSRILIHRFARPVMELGTRIQNLAAGRVEQARELRSSNREMNAIAQSIEIIVKDIAHREEQRKAAEYLGFHDSMTGLYNRRFFEEELCRMDCPHNYPLCLICADANGLKMTNDVFGHAVGDRLIKTVAACLEKNCRAGDMVARTGGDEFAMILPRTTAEEAQQVIERIKASFPCEPVCGAEVSTALGYAVKVRVEQSMDEVLRAADSMMYENKLGESQLFKQRLIASLKAGAHSDCYSDPEPAFRREKEGLFKNSIR